jgi:hypothetical protein
MNDGEHEYATNDEPPAAAGIEQTVKQTEEDLDAAIGDILDAIERLERTIEEHRREHEQRSNYDTGHESAAAGSPEADSGDAAKRDERPEPTHFYFRRIGRE